MVAVNRIFTDLMPIPPCQAHPYLTPVDEVEHHRTEPQYRCSARTAAVIAGVELLLARSRFGEDVGCLALALPLPLALAREKGRHDLRFPYVPVTY